MSKCTMRIDVTTTRTVGNKFVLHGIQRKQWSKWNVEHTIQNHYNKFNTQTLTSHYIRIFITEMFASQWQQFFKQISACKFSPDVLKMSPWDFLYALSVVHYGPRRTCVRSCRQILCLLTAHVGYRQTDMRQADVRETDRHETDGQTDVRQTDVRQTDRRETDRQTWDRQTDVRQTGRERWDRRTIWRMELLHSATWHDHDIEIEFAR